MRRAVCNLTTKNYNRIFLGLTRNLRKDGFSAARLRELLLAQSGDSAMWPSDTSFREAWLQKPLYGPLNSPKLVHLFGRLNQTFMSSKAESVVFAKPPTVEHIMPQEWLDHWPLPDGAKGMDLLELHAAPDSDPRAGATRQRETILQTLGNLTILSNGLNSAQKNLPWNKKKPELMINSLLPLNQILSDVSEWDEPAILKRAEDLFKRAVCIWAR